MDGKFLSLKWNNHWSTFFSTLSDLREKEVYNDVTLACDGKFFPVHKLVLSVCSEYFEQIFDRIDCRHPVIILKDIRAGDLEALLNYMYIGEVSVLQDNLGSLIKAAECLRIKGLAVPDENAQNKDIPSSTDSRGARTKRNSSEENGSDVKKRRCDNDNVGKRVTKDFEQDKLSDSVKANKNPSSSRQFEDETSLVSAIDEKDVATSSLVLKKKDEEDSYHSDDVIYVDKGEIKEEQLELEPYVDFDPSKEEEFSESTSMDCGYEGGEPSHQFPEFDNSDHSSTWDQEGSSLHTAGDLYEPTEGGPSQAYSTAVFGSLKYPKQYVCNICGYTTYYGSNLRKHLNTHTGAKPYSCWHCPYKSSQSSNLKSHMKHVHSINARKEAVIYETI